MRLSTISFTNPGGRTPNEDALKYEVEGENGSWAVADGLGGHVGGETASQLAVAEAISNADLGRSMSAEEIEAVYNGINAKIFTENGPRTTLTTAYLANGEFRFANIGDTRLYYFRKGELFQRTADHSAAYGAYASGEMDYGDLRFHPDRSRLSRAIGVTDKVTAQVYPIIVPEPGDAFLICTDGFWEYIFETEMEIDLLKSATPKDWVDFMLLRIVRRMKVDCDNFSAIATLIQ